ncbi:MAG: FAD-dependent oxidoreductase [Chthoniobacteraceae bacterium]
MQSKFPSELHEFDVCVIGGGMAGVCAAIASARNGAKTAILQDRPVFGGNASSEVRMWICGAHGEHNKETGILEEIQLENQYRNPGGNYSIWDSVLWAKIFFQLNLTPFLNCSCTEAEMDGNRIVAVKAWQLTSQTWHEIQAKLFIDCSGDSILAPATGANFRTGREARAEFDEDIQPQQADSKTMGNSLLIQMRRTDEPQQFIAPSWAYKFECPSDLPHRINGVNEDNFWWLEVGGLQDTIRNAEPIRDELMRITYGVVDYIKNRAPERAQAGNWAVEWIGSLPGKRESRRYLGDHVLTQNDVRDGGRFEDIIAYGGWSMDDHHPAGIYFPGKPTIFHPAPSPYGIPYRSLYSRNITNLLFAGRNISVTHAALSSTRVMATCAILGQAAGTAAALCAKHARNPRDLNSGAPLRELQATVMEDDCWLPTLRREISQLAHSGCLSDQGDNAAALLDGLDRDRKGENHAWSGPQGANIDFQWMERVKIDGARIVFDSDLNFTKRMPCSYPCSAEQRKIPASLVKAFRLECINNSGKWQTVFREGNNYLRLVYVPLAIESTKLRLVVEETWGAPDARIFAFEPLSSCRTKVPAIPKGETFAEVRSKISPQDFSPPAGMSTGS